MDLNKIINEEIQKLVEESEKKAPEIAKKLETLRKKLIPAMTRRESDGEVLNRLEKRVQMQTVSELLEIPVNELMLHFLNNVKASNDRHLIEYHLGHVYFWADCGCGQGEKCDHCEPTEKK
jgi:hypothetical protein